MAEFFRPKKNSVFYSTHLVGKRTTKIFRVKTISGERVENNNGKELPDMK